MNICQRYIFAIIAAFFYLNACMFASGESKCKKSEVKAVWAPWSAWSPCSATCRPASQTRTRDCADVRVKHGKGGKPCPGKHLFETRRCKDLDACPAPLRKAKVCGNEREIFLDCDSREWPGVLNIQKVIYGNDANITVAVNECPKNEWHKACVPSKTQIAKNTNYARSRCDDRESCMVPINEGLLGDTCHNRKEYMKVYYRCSQPQKGPRHTEVVCGWGQHRVLSCESTTEGSHIHIQKVIYGNDKRSEFTQTDCPRHHWKQGCVPREPLLSGHVEAVRNVCEGKPQCTVNHSVAHSRPGGDSCHGAAKMLKVIYSCH